MSRATLRVLAEVAARDAGLVAALRALGSDFAVKASFALEGLRDDAVRKDFDPRVASLQIIRRLGLRWEATARAVRIRRPRSPVAEAFASAAGAVWEHVPEVRPLRLRVMVRELSCGEVEIEARDDRGIPVFVRMQTPVLEHMCSEGPHPAWGIA